ncbi:hypothetical protein Taro_026797 [Colocasia esculenta]|uniref:Uncharacterized protein n=1 Tax=Colocasia esculenta TaxID=4460 RepID=A0A843VI74_COLES|nr:hypothetical protein [Colocasia esculenta]
MKLAKSLFPGSSSSIASKDEEQYTVRECVSRLKTMVGYSQELLMRALPLFEIPSKRVVFMLPVKLNMARYKCYVVWVGRRPGVYYSWSECFEQVNGYPGARYKGFATVEEGNMAFRGIIMGQTSSANDTVPFQAPSVMHETQPREAEERVVYQDENAMFLAVGEMLMSSTMDEDEEDTTPIHRPMHTSRHTGHVWVHEVLHGHERRCYNTFRMNPSMFVKLRDILVERELIRDSRYVTTSEQLAMFLYAMGHGVATGAMCEHFQHSSETISYYVNRVIKAIALLRFTYIVLPSGTDLVHPRIRHDDRFYPYFKDAIGATDGTYILAHVLKDRQARYRNRKNVISQNVMGICGFDLIFHYVSVGFEGAAADMTVFRRAIDVGGFTVPLGKYYLVDSGYGNVAQLLAPYRGEQYHIS